jgi:DNA-binding LacI/PurR family transcriptional regulator
VIRKYGYRRPSPVARQQRVGVMLTELGPQRNAIRYWIDNTLSRRPDCLVTVAQLDENQRNQLRAPLDGYRTALVAAGLPAEPDLVIRAQLTRDGGGAAAFDLLRRSHRPTAIFAANDLQALGVYHAARTAGLRIPTELSVVGFDDLPLATVVLSRGEELPQVGLELATTLTVRQSTAPPAA